MGTTNLTTAPGVLQQGNYGALDLRRMVTTMLGEGIVASGDFAVTQRAAGANMSVDVAAGQAYVKGDTATDQGHYFVRSSGVLNATVTAADATNPRIDRVVLEIKDDAHDLGGLNLGRIRTIDGTPTSGATLTNLSGAAAVPNSCMLLANVLVPAASATVTTANVQDRRAGVPVPGRQVFGAYAESTADYNTATGTALSFSLVGNGVDPIAISAFAIASNNVSAELCGFKIRDVTAGADIATPSFVRTRSANSQEVLSVPGVRVPAFSGSKTFGMVNATPGSGFPVLYGTAGTRHWMRATWAG